jgi:hypothetical protein
MTTRTAANRRRTAARPPADDAERPAVGLPTFSPPIGRGDDPPAPADPDPGEEERTTGPTLPPDPAARSWLPYGGDGSADTIRTRTEDSSDQLTTPTTAGKAETARNAGVLLAGILTVAAGLVAVVLARAGRELRRPTRDETRAVARPIARILVRHIPAEMITADLADMGEAAAGVSDYMSAGPVAPRVVAVQHIGMVPPDDPAQVPYDTSADAPPAPDDRTPGQAFHAALTAFDQVHPSALGDPGPAPKVTYLE